MTINMNQSSLDEIENDDPFVKVTLDSMRHIFGFTPHPFQRKAMLYLIKMKINHCSPTLLVHGTSGSTSSICQTVGIIEGGILLIIQKTLSFSSDQTCEISLALSKHEGFHDMQLDSINVDNQKQQLFNSLSSRSKASNKKIYTFASPEVLIK